MNRLVRHSVRILDVVTLAALVLIVSVGVHVEGTAKGKIPGTDRPTRIVFTSSKTVCPPVGKPPCIASSNIWVVNSDGSGTTPLTGILCFEPVWSPDGTKIAFTSNRALDESDAMIGNGMANIWVMNADGSGATPLAALDGTAGSGAPAWSPDGRKLAFSSTRALNGSNDQAGNGNIWVMNSDGSGAIPLGSLARSIRFIRSTGVVWSPDGHKLAFVSDRALDGSDQQNTAEITNIWVMNADGSGLMPLTRLTAANTSVTNPVWSPDSRRLAFSWNRAMDNTDAVKPISARNIWVVNIDNSYARPLTKLTAKFAIATDPEWSPDASKLAFSSNGNVWAMNADGSGAIPLTHFISKSPGVSLKPVWSGDGAKIAFEYRGIAESGNNIWVMNADGSDATLVTRSGAVSGRLGWRPKVP